MNSGFAADNVSAALQAILTRKAEDKRQALLDSITQQNADTNRMQAEGEMEWRKAQSKREEAIADEKKLNDWYRGMPLDNDQVDWMKSRKFGGLIDEKPTGNFEPFTTNEDGSIDQGPVQEMERSYKGSPTEQKEAKQSEALKTLMQKDPEFLKKPYLQQWLTLRELGINNVDPTKLKGPEADEIPLVWVDRNGNAQVKGKYPKGTHFANQPAPSGVGSETYDIYEDDNPATPPRKFGRKSGKFSPIEDTGDPNASPTNIRKVGTTTPQPPKPVEEQWRKVLPQLRKVVSERARAKGLRSEQQAMLDANINAARATVINLYNGPGASPAFKNQLVSIMTNPATANLSVDRLIVGLNKQRTAKLGLPPLSDEETQLMRTLIPEIQGQ